MRMFLQLLETIVDTDFRGSGELQLKHLNEAVNLTLAPRAVSFDRGIGPQDLLEGHLGVIHRGCGEKHMQRGCICEGMVGSSIIQGIKNYRLCHFQ